MEKLKRGKIFRIQASVRSKRYYLTSHAEREREVDRITIREIEEVLLCKECEIIEDYPDDPRGASCLVLGFTAKGRPVHIVCGISEPEVLIIITVYQPTPSQWIDWRVRKE